MSELRRRPYREPAPPPARPSLPLLRRRGPAPVLPCPAGPGASQPPGADPQRRAARADRRHRARLLPWLRLHPQPRLRSRAASATPPTTRRARRIRRASSRFSRNSRGDADRALPAARQGGPRDRLRQGRVPGALVRARRLPRHRHRSRLPAAGPGGDGIRLIAELLRPARISHLEPRCCAAGTRSSTSRDVRDVHRAGPRRSRRARRLSSSRSRTPRGSSREGAFWDIYYEHCSYFTLRLARPAVPLLRLRASRSAHRLRRPVPALRSPARPGRPDRRRTTAPRSPG